MTPDLGQGGYSVLEYAWICLHAVFFHHLLLGA
jgi:hypothetical protein